MIMYLDAMNFVALAIISEAVFRRILSVTNAAGDIVTVAIVEKREKTSEETGKNQDKLKQ